jgi:hypothetical protein
MTILRSPLPRDLVSLKQNVKLVSIVQVLMAITYLYKQAGNFPVIATAVNINMMHAFYASLFIIGCKVEEKFVGLSVNNDCIRPYDAVIYECTVIGDQGGFTSCMGGRLLSLLKWQKLNICQLELEIHLNLLIERAIMGA